MQSPPPVLPDDPLLPELELDAVVGGASQVQAASLQTSPVFSQPRLLQSQPLPVLPELELLDEPVEPEPELLDSVPEEPELELEDDEADELECVPELVEPELPDEALLEVTEALVEPVLVEPWVLVELAGSPEQAVSAATTNDA